MPRPPPISTRSYTLCPYTTLFRSQFPQHRQFACAEAARPVGRPGHEVDHAVGERQRHRHVVGRPELPQIGQHREVHGLLGDVETPRSEEHTSELQSLMRISYAVFCLKKKINNKIKQYNHTTI